MEEEKTLVAYSKLDGSEIHLFEVVNSVSTHIVSLCGNTILSNIDWLKPSMCMRKATPEEFYRIKKCVQK